ncbi:hypothetical protein GIY30_00225 [Gordonia sp. HNM0687]|uniref:Uncharacterized protein n=1 Tax=Gordonia mangrovi TaxID=2665643 RepID=A0A6L7GMN1_9ACTN|nr:hypothetical protein [Gordonia mangrovi]MDY6807624.1 hypothetical protein [Actinomycetota bacterium]MXP19788.1 hypothetical protein [Gordonia mangrovi]UVF79585.1 hypothetical protein NWF22_07025 [Gordonia mangrovi]
MAARACTSPTQRWAQRRWTSMLDTTALAIPQILMMGLIMFAVAQSPAPVTETTPQPPAVVVAR